MTGLPGKLCCCCLAHSPFQQMNIGPSLAVSRVLLPDACLIHGAQIVAVDCMNGLTQKNIWPGDSEPDFPGCPYTRSAAGLINSSAWLICKMKEPGLVECSPLLIEAVVNELVPLACCIQACTCRLQRQAPQQIVSCLRVYGTLPLDFSRQHDCQGKLGCQPITCEDAHLSGDSINRKPSWHAKLAKANLLLAFLSLRLGGEGWCFCK